MELRVLRYFLAVAREETILGAAESLHVTQPTLSRQLIELEEELGKKLFLRGNRKITLTEEGMFFRRRAQEIIELVDKTTSDFHSENDSVHGDVYIGGGETDAMRIIAKAVKKLSLKYPHIQFHLYSGSGEDVAERLDKGLLDFGIFVEPADMKKYDYLRLPNVDTWGLLMQKDNPLAKLTGIRPEHLWNVPLICSGQSLVRNELSGWLKDDFEKLRVVSTYNLIYNAALMVAEGVGCALCLDKLVNATDVSELCFCPLEPRLNANLDIVWKKHQVFSSAAGMFLEQVREELQNG